MFGTEGFVAPEQYEDAHAVTPAADVFSLARCLGWVLAGRPRTPSFDIPPGPWSHILLAMSRADPNQRLPLHQVVLEFRGKPASPESVYVLAERLRPDSADSDLLRFVVAAVGSADDEDLILDVIPRLDSIILRRLVAQEEGYVLKIVSATVKLAMTSFGYRNFDHLNAVLRVPFELLRGAVAAGKWSLSSNIADVYFPFEVHADRYANRDRVRRWLSGLRGEAATRVASVLRAHPDAIRFYANGWSAPTADRVIREALLAHKKP